MGPEISNNIPTGLYILHMTSHVKAFMVYSWEITQMSLRALNLTDDNIVKHLISSALKNGNAKSWGSTEYLTHF
jgi:hypothetical protein